MEGELGLDLAIEANQADRLLGARRAARWFLQAHEWEHLEERITEILGSYEPPMELVFPGVVELLKETRLKGRRNLSIVKLPNTRRGSAAIPAICETLGPDAFLQLRTGESHFLLVPHDSLPRIRSAVEVNLTTIGPVAEIKLVWGSRNGQAKRFVWALVGDLLDQAGVKTVSNQWYTGNLSVLVPQHEALLTAGSIEGLAARLSPLLPGFCIRPGMT